MDIFCVKCRKKVQPTKITAGMVEFTRKKTGMPGTRYSLQAVCPNCGINMKRFIKQEDAAKYQTVEEKPAENKTPNLTPPPNEKNN